MAVDEFATASRWSLRSSLSTPGCRNPILEMAVQQWDHSDPMLYRLLYHAGILYIAAAPVHALVLAASTNHTRPGRYRIDRLAVDVPSPEDRRVRRVHVL
jgi:hypothetical protein